MTSMISETVRISASPVITCKGKGKAAREMAFMQIAPAAMIETQSRGDLISYLRTALGASPTETETKTAQTETIIGRVAARLPAGEFPNTCKDDDSKLQFARDLVMSYAAPAQEGKAARKLRTGQKGRRSPMQHKVIRAADEYWSQVKAELGLGTAQTTKERNATRPKRSTNANPVRGDGKGAAPTHAPTLSDTLPNGGKVSSATDACRVVETAAATLLAFANKNAKLLPTDYGSAVMAFKTAINAAANAKGERDAKTAK